MSNLKVYFISFFVFMACLCSARPGQWQWIKQGMDSAYSSFPLCISPVVNNCFYVAGSFTGSPAIFGSDTLTAANGATNLYIVKYDVTGQVRWARAVSGTRSPYWVNVAGIATDAAGNLYITGAFSDSIVTFGTYTLHGVASTHIIDNYFIAKYDSSGNVMWAETSGQGIWSSGMCADPQGNVYVSGHYNVQLQYVVLGNDTLSGQPGAFIARYDGQGNIKWILNGNSSNPNGFAYGSGPIASDAASNIYMINANNSYNIIFGSDTVYNPDGRDEFYMVKVDSSGNTQWLNILDGPSDQYSYLGATPAGNVYVAGYYDSTLIIGSDTLNTSASITPFIAKFNNAGTAIWAKSLDLNITPQAITDDADDNMYLSGYITSTAVFNHDTISGGNLANTFVAKYDGAGSPEWAAAMNGYGNNQWNYSQSMSIDDNLNIYVAGFFNNTTLVASNDTVNATPGAYNTYVARLSQCFNAVIPVISITGDTLQTGIYSSYQWLMNGTPLSNGNSRFLQFSQNGSYRVIVRDSTGCSDTSAAYQVNALGVNAAPGIGNFTIYPNPGNGSFILQTQNAIGSHFIITDVTGNIVLSQTIYADKEFVDLSSVAPGIYILSATTKQGPYVGKVVIEK
ncbi:MAG: hypothetical protein JWO06_3410 [Bacteroidota bacterium]|nr:hypothetical protein [Bacteroidota bacterium]